MTKAKTPANSMESYVGRTLGPYTWFAWSPKEGLHYLRTPYPEKWIRLTDSQWNSTHALASLGKGLFYVAGHIPYRTVVPARSATPKRCGRRPFKYRVT